MSKLGNPLPLFTGLDGLAIDGGSIYIGEAGKNPETNPISVYWDQLLTTPASQPIKLSGGYPARYGAPSNIYTAISDYSLTIRDSCGRLVFSSLNAAGAFVNTQDILVTPMQFGAVGDGVTSDQSALESAVAYCQATGSPLYWPAGTFVSINNIPNFQSIRHRGPGAVKRGSSIFYPDPSKSQSNTIYVSTTGNDTNDGLTSAYSLLTVQAAFDALKNYGPVLNGYWTVQLAAGTYNAAAQLVGLRSANDLTIRGPSVGGSPNVPTAIIDGTGVVSNTVGWYLMFYVRAAIYDVKFQNWTSVAGDAYGLCADGHCQLYVNNCHFYNCRYAGLSCDNLTQLRMQGGIVDSCLYTGVRLYSQVSASVGYNGSVAGDSTEIKNCGVGISGRVSSRVHVDYYNIHNNDTGIVTEYNTRCVVNYTKVQNNNIGWYATLTSDNEQPRSLLRGI